jgi:hypothetical protein
MSNAPIAAPHTLGRIFGTDWSIANVAKLLRSNAGRGAWRETATTGGSTAKVNQNYLRTVSARHLPTAVSLIFMRLEEENSWYASLCFANDADYLPWQEEIAEQWLWALFGEDRHLLVEAPKSPTARQFTLTQSRGFKR